QRVERRQAKHRPEDQLAEKFERVEGGGRGRVEPGPPLPPVDPEIDRRGNPEGYLKEDRDHRDGDESSLQAERQAHGERAEAEGYREQQNAAGTAGEHDREIVERRLGPLGARREAEHDQAADQERQSEDSEREPEG